MPTCTVPTCAVGTYTIGLAPGVPGNELTFMGDCQTPSQVIPMPALGDAYIVIEMKARVNLRQYQQGSL